MKKFGRDLRQYFFYSLRKLHLPQSGKQLAVNKKYWLGRAIPRLAKRSVPFLFRQRKSIYRLGGKNLLPPQRQLLPFGRTFPIPHASQTIISCKNRLKYSKCIVTFRFTIEARLTRLALYL